MSSIADPFSQAADLLDPPRKGVALYHDDPAGFVRDCIAWPVGKGPTPYQNRNGALLLKHGRLAVRGPHGLGKTSFASWMVLWFALTRDALGEDWKVVTTASAWRQLEKYLWPEIHKWAAKLNWATIARKPFTARELMTLSLKLSHGEAFAAACEDPAKIEGAHADQVLFIYDEAKTIPAATFDASEGAFSGAGSDTAQQAYALASSTPGPPEGRFYEIHKREPGLEDWHAVHVKLEDVIRAGRVSKDWAMARRRQWGPTSALFLNRVLGEFAESGIDGVIPLRWVELANDRWQAWKDSGEEPGDLTGVGVDVGGDAGGDLSIIALRHDWLISELRPKPSQTTMELSGTVLGILEARWHPAKSISVIVDAIGIGSGVVARLRETCKEVVTAFKASEGTTRKDRAGEMGFLNQRAGAWWNMRELLDPESGVEVALPSDDDLVGELTASRWKATSNAKIQIESKRDIRKRLGKSTDHADAVIQAFWPEGGNNVGNFAGNPEASFFATAPSASKWAVT